MSEQEAISTSLKRLRDKIQQLEKQLSDIKNGTHFKTVIIDDCYALENSKLTKQNKIMRDALEYTANQVTWVDQGNQVVILTYGYCVEAARQALKDAEEV